MCLEVTDMFFGPSDSLDSPVCLSACDTHRFDSCLNEWCIGKRFRHNKCFLSLLSVVSVSKAARSITNDIFTPCDRVKPEHGMNGIGQHCPATHQGIARAQEAKSCSRPFLRKLFLAGILYSYRFAVLPAVAAACPRPSRLGRHVRGTFWKTLNAPTGSGSSSS
jgi:hypothetical protein